MKYLLLALSLLVASLPAAMADEFFPVFVNGQPAATTPLLGGEKVPIIQSGITKTLPPYILIGSQAIPLGGSAPSQGTGNKVQLASGSFVNGHCLQYAADGSAVDSGTGCGGGGSTGYVTVSADNTCGTDVTSTINAALATGETVYIPKGCYKVTSDLIFTTKNQILFGDGPGCYSVLSGICTGGPFGTVLYANSNAGFTHGVLYFNSGEQGPQIQNLGISLAQPDTATRASLNNFVPEIYAQNQPRFRLFNLKLDNCIICVDMRGNSGGAYLDTLQMAGYGTTSTGGGIVMIDGSLDTVRIDGLHIYNFDMTTNQQTIFHAPATVGISSGRMDDLEISNLLTICGTGINFFYGTGGPGGTSWQAGPTFGTIVNSGFDTYNGIVAAGSGSGQTGPTIAMSASYFSLGSASVQAIVATAGNFQLSSINIGQGNGGSNPPVVLSDATGSLNFSWDSGYMLNAGNDITNISVTGDANSVVLLNNLRFFKAQNTNYTLPSINIASGPRATLTNNSIIDKGTGTGTFINVAADTYHVVMGNSAPGWTLTFPTATYGIYTCNTVGPSPSCGSGGGSSTPTFTSVNSNTYNDAAGNNLLAVTGGQTYLGNTTDGSVLLKTSIAPNGAGLFLNGTSTNYWSQVWGGTVGAITGMTINSNVVPSISGAPTNGHCVQFSGSSGLISDTGSACGTSGVSSLTAGTNLSVSSSTGAVTVSTVANPTFSSYVETPQIVDTSGNNIINNGGGSTNVGLSSYGTIVAHNNFIPSSNNAYVLGTSGDAWSAIYGILYYAGPSNTAGVSCSGTPTSSFASVNGIVTHC